MLRRWRRIVLGLLVAFAAGVLLTACDDLEGVVQIDGGEWTTCALHDDGRVSCWGALSEISDTKGPIEVPGITTATELSHSFGTTCALLEDGTVRCWYVGEPWVVEEVHDAVSIAAGSETSCALLADKTVRCWGDGPLGDGTSQWSPTRGVEVLGIDTAVAVAAGFNHACAVLEDGTIRCWGHNGLGSLGDGTTESALTPVEVVGIDSATAVASFWEHSCALLEDGTVRCWGDNWWGQLGDGTTELSPIPVDVIGIDDAAGIAAAGRHTCVMRALGSMQCWGRNHRGQLGDGTTTNSLTPVTVTDIDDAVSVGAGRDHTCAVLADRTARCWGDNGPFDEADDTGVGRLGDRTAESSAVPVRVRRPFLIGTLVDLQAGNQHACAVTRSGVVACWGDNSHGQLGDGTNQSSSTPAPIAGLPPAIGVATGDNHSCSAHDDGSVRCWGDNSFGQLGDGTTTNSPTPVVVEGITTQPVPTDATPVAAGANHTCVLLDLVSVRCWGANSSGQLGNGSTKDSPTPVAPGGLSGDLIIGYLTAGDHHTCVSGKILLSAFPFRWGDRRTYCWGANSSGQLGDGTTTDSATPVIVEDFADQKNAVVSSLSAGGDHTCAIFPDQIARCWGDNTHGQLGDGTTTSSPTAVTVADTIGARDVTAGAVHTCATLDDNTARCWGANDAGQLGSGTTTGSLIPVTVEGTRMATQVTGGTHHTCAILLDETARCWGANSSGQLGDDTTTSSRYPVGVFHER